MADPVLRRANGLDRPRYFDRQLLLADDLSLEQGYADLRRALLARHVLGWGVAAGLVLRVRPEATGAAALTISPGYALTPLGDEVYLPHETVFDRIEPLVRDLCCDTPDCALVDASGAPLGAVHAWIVARPADADGGPRAAMPQGCGHPGNAMRPSRRCGGAQIEIRCAIGPPHADPEPDGDALHDAVCGPWGPELATTPPDEANYVVLGRIESRIEGIFATPRDRRRVGRLDLVGRMACAPRPVTIRYVTHIQRDEADADRAIDRLAGINRRGVLWIETLEEAIAAIERGGIEYQTLPATGSGRTLLVRRRRTKKFLRTSGDGKPPNNLLSLPDIGR